MNDTQQRFFALATRLEALSEEMTQVREELNLTMTELGLETYHQDPSTQLVYKIVKPKGTFTYYRDVDYKRTAKPGEFGGTVLAKKEAEEQGFKLPGKA